MAQKYFVIGKLWERPCGGGQKVIACVLHVYVY